MRRGRVGYQDVVEALPADPSGRRRRLAPSEAAAAATTDALVQQALELVDAPIQQRLSLADVARELAVTPGHLTEAVRQQTGRPLGEWILQRRLARARLLLAETTEPVGAVSAACGFGDVGHFPRQFRRHHAMSPSAWRAAVAITAGPEEPTSKG